MELNCIVIDDEAMSRGVISHYIEKTNFLKLQYECDNAIDALNILQEKDADVDVIYLDIEMPEMSGIEMMKVLKNSYEIIVTTSRERYAVEAFEISVTDYLVKPIEYGRFIKASNKAKDNIEALDKENEVTTEIFVKSDSKMVRLQLCQIQYIEALADYVIFHTEKGKFIVHHTMKGIEKRLPSTQFARVHRSYIVNTNYIDYLEDFSIVIKDKPLPIGASYKERFFNRLNFL